MTEKITKTTSAADMADILFSERKRIAVERYPQNLDFTKTINGTTYAVKSHFHKDAAECLLAKICRLLNDNTNLAE